jgi:hypothetical protein
MLASSAVGGIESAVGYTPKQPSARILCVVLTVLGCPEIPRNCRLYPKLHVGRRWSNEYSGWRLSGSNVSTKAEWRISIVFLPQNVYWLLLIRPYRECRTEGWTAPNSRVNIEGAENPIAATHLWIPKLDGILTCYFPISVELILDDSVLQRMSVR